MLRIIVSVVALAFVSTVALASDGMIVKPSAHSVSVTLDRLAGLLKEKGIAVVVRVDHSAAAKKAGLQLNPTQLLVFGNPKLGTPLMQSNAAIGIDLPLKALAWRDAGGKVWIGYNDPAYLARRHAIDDREKVIAKMSSVLDKLTSAAAKP